MVLIDGIPFSHTRANRANSEEDLPLFFAKRVEFLKGPGSALYGISAFSGVMNLVAKDLDQNGTKVESKMSVGNYDFKRRAMFNILHKSDLAMTRLSVSYYGKDATMQYLGDSAKNYNANSRMRDNVTSMFINGSHKITGGKLKGLNPGFIYSKKSGGLGDFWMDFQNQNYQYNELTWEQLVPYLRYERKFGKFTLNTYLKGNMSTEKGYVGGYQSTYNAGGSGGVGAAAYNVRTIDKEFFLEGRYPVIARQKKEGNLIAGSNVVSRYSTGAPQSYSYTITSGPGLTFDPDPGQYKRSSTYNIYSGFAQYQQNLPILKGMTITAGARLDAGQVKNAKGDSITAKYSQLSPRIAIVQRLTGTLNAKLMYGSALRAPLIKEVGLNEETFNKYSSQGLTSLQSQFPSLTPEHINTLEGGMTFNTSKVSAVVVVFYNETKSALSKKRVIGSPDNDQITANYTGIIAAKGYEMELNVLPTRNFKIGANASTALATYNLNDSTKVTTANVPTYKINGILNYTMYAPTRISVTLVGRWVENFRTGIVNNPVVGSRMKGYNVFDLNILGDITKNVGVELQVRNLLDAEIITPAFFTAGRLNVPYPGRSILVSASFRF